MGNSKIVTLKTFNTLGEAEIMKSFLDSAGVNNVLVNDVLSSVLPVDSFARVRIEVAEEDLELARGIIAAKFDKGELAAQMKAAADEEK